MTNKLNIALCAFTFYQSKQHSMREAREIGKKKEKDVITYDNDRE